MKIIIYILLGLLISGFVWIWVASLITYTCNQWWTAREAYRKRTDDKVKDLLGLDYERQN